MKNLGRILAILAGLALGAATAGTTAIAGDYIVEPCSLPGSPSNTVTYLESPANNPGFEGWPICPGGSMIRAQGTTYPGDTASLKFETPQGTGFLGVTFNAYTNRSDNGVTANFIFNNAGGADTEVGDVPIHRNQEAWLDWFDVTDGQPRSIFRSTLKCERPVDPCGGNAQVSFYEIKFKMRDSGAPSSADFLGGSLFNAGTVSGMRTALVGGIDNGSGISWLTMNVNDVWSYAYASTCNLQGLRPCPRTPTTTFNVNTEGANFVNGMNKITLCAQDYGSPRNVTCDNRYINVAK